MKPHLMHLIVAAILLAVPAFAETAPQPASSPISLEFRDADIKDVMRAMGQAADLNLIVGDTVTGRVSLSVKNVDVWEALESILKTRGLTYVRNANMVRVVPVAEARDDDMEDRVFSLGFANGQDVLPIVEKMKSDRGKASVDLRMNAVVVRDLSLNADRIGRLIKALDVRIPQVLIEAKIVEVSSSYSREFGVQWGGKYTGHSRQGTTGISGGTTGASNGAAPAVGATTFYPQTGDVGMSGNAYAVNLPAAVGPGSGGALGFTFGTLNGNASLDLQLSAMQSTGNGKILSSPKVVTVNNKEAKIASGVDIPVRVITTTTAGSTAQVMTISANLMLSTIPIITQDDRISLTIKVEKAEPDFSRQVDGIPTITKRSANTELVVNDGETVVLGGILTKNSGQSESGVPFLSQIPILGWLFKKKSTYEDSTELMIFITPTVIRDARPAPQS
jgi:type IV pilus assembly protein PilQ